MRLIYYRKYLVRYRSLGGETRVTCYVLILHREDTTYVRMLLMSEKLLTPIQILMACFSIASAAGIASLLRSNKPLTSRVVVAAGLYSGLFGLVIGLIWFNYFAPTNTTFLVGVSGLAGLGGVSLVDVAVQLLTRGANITVKIDQDVNLDNEEPSNE